MMALLFAAGCASLPPNVERTESHALRDTATTQLGRSSESLLAAHPGESGFRPQNLAKLAWRLDRAVDASGQLRIVWIDASAEPHERLDEPGVSAWRKFSVWLLSLPPIESRL